MSGSPNNWTISDEVRYVKHLGTGKWHQGSDLRHTREWWMRRYITLNHGRLEPYVLAGLLEANKILSDEGKKNLEQILTDDS